MENDAYAISLDWVISHVVTNRKKSGTRDTRHADYRKSRDFDPIFKVSLANRSAMTVTAPLAFWT